MPRIPHQTFQSFWSTDTGWGTFSYRVEAANATVLTIQVLAGKLSVRSIEMTGSGKPTCAGDYGRIQARAIQHGEGQHHDNRTTYQLEEPILIVEGREFSIELGL